MTGASKYFDLVQVGEGAYAAIVKPGRGAIANAGLVDLGDVTVVFDTFQTLTAAEDLKRAAEELFGRPVGVVINSHAHMDHAFGNQVFVGATIISTAITRELILQRGTAIVEMAKKHPEYPEQLYQMMQEETDESKQAELAIQYGNIQEFDACLPQIRLMLPNLIFENSLMLHGSKRSAQLLTYGGGHTESDAFLLLPDEGIAFLGDLAAVGNHSLLRDGDAENWIRILERIEQHPVRTMIPGHGSVGGMKDIVLKRHYLADILHLAQQLHSPEEADSIAIPDTYANWEASALFARNLRYAKKG